MWQVKKTVRFEQQVVTHCLTAEEAYDVVDELVSKGAARQLFQVQSVPDKDVAVPGLFFKSGDYGVSIYWVKPSHITFGISHPDWEPVRYQLRANGTIKGIARYKGAPAPRINKIPPQIREWIMSLEVPEA